jgi:hypothetical protein
MRKLTLFLTCSLIYLSCFSQKHKEIGVINDLRLIDLNGQLGVMDNYDNFVVTPDEYTKITFDEKNWVYRCYKGKKTFEIVNENNEKVQSELFFTDILENDENGLLKVKSEKGVGLIKNWKEFIPPIYDKVTVEAETYHECCMNYILEKDGKKGLYVGNKLILKAEYNDFSKVVLDDYVNHLIISKNNKKGLISMGKYEVAKETILPTEYQEIDFLMEIDGNLLYKIKSNNLYGIYNSNKKKKVIPTIIQQLDWKNKNALQYGFVIPVKHNNQSRYIITDFKSDSTYIITDEIIYFDDDTYLAVKNTANNYQFIDLNQNLRLDPEVYLNITVLTDGIALNKNGKWGLLENFNDSPLFEIKYDSLEALKKAIKEQYD